MWHGKKWVFKITSSHCTVKCLLLRKALCDFKHFPGNKELTSRPVCWMLLVWWVLWVGFSCSGVRDQHTQQWLCWQDLGWEVKLLSEEGCVPSCCPPSTRSTLDVPCRAHTALLPEAVWLDCLCMSVLAPQAFCLLGVVAFPSGMPHHLL